MSWLPILLLAAATLGVAIAVLRLPRTSWMLFAATILFGLAGYGVQGTPGYGGAPKRADITPDSADFSMIDVRREFFSPNRMPARYVTIADAFARRGQFEDAANMLGNAVAENPRDAEAWVALGNALTDHAGGTLTAPAIYAFRQAERIAPQNPAGGYFMGIGLLRSGEPLRARAIWAELLDKAPANAEWRAPLAERLMRLDGLLQQIEPQARQVRAPT